MAETMEQEVQLKDKELPKEEGGSGGGGKKKKQKKQKSNKTQSLNDFLADSSIGSKFTAKEPPKRMGSWADAMEERLDGEEVTTTWQGGGGGGGGDFDRSQLPSAPRKAQARNVDRSRLPKSPPYTVYLGNLSYECNEDDIISFFERKNLKVREVRLPTDSGTSRLKGFGYAELESVTALLEALELTGEMLRNRSVTIDLATSKSAEGDGGRGDRYRRDSDDRTATDWRRGSAEEVPPNSRDYQNGPSSYGDRYDRPWAGRGRYGDESRGGGGYESRGRRGYGSGGWNERPEYRDSYGERQRDYQDGRRRQDGWYDRDRRGPPRYRDEGYRQGPSPPEHYERPRLQLQPRSRPIDAVPSESRSSIFGAAQPVDTAAREREIEEKRLKDKEMAAEEEERAQREKELREAKAKEAVFGGAKPVDTASREKEIEEKLRRKQEEDALLLQKKQRERKWSSDGERKGRDRRGSDRSWEGEEGGRSSRSPEKSEDSGKMSKTSETDKKVELVRRRSSGEDSRGHEEGGKGRDGRQKERYRDDRGRRERSIEEDWIDGGRGGRRAEQVAETSSQREGERTRGGVGRRGGGRGRGGKVRDVEKRDVPVEKEKRKVRGPATREESGVRKYEEPQQPVFSQPSRYAMLDDEGDEELTENKPLKAQDD